jgi:hypothetical protein
VNEAFWVAGSEYHFPAEEIPDVFQASRAADTLRKSLADGGIKQNWVDEIHWCLNTENRTFPPEEMVSLGFSPNTPIFVWARQDQLDHFLVHSIVRGIVSGDQNLVCLGEFDGRGISVICLASHTAVGRYNLDPQACIAARFALPVNIKLQSSEDLKVLQSEIEKRDIDVDAVACLAVIDSETTEVKNFGTAFPKAEFLSSNSASPAGAIYQVNALARAVDISKRRYGLLISVSKNDPSLVTLIEKV